jgi:phosphoglycolate phosphatase
VETLLAECEVERERTMMVGDSGVDIRTARNAGISACGVTYGFQPETLKQYPPDLVIDRIAQLPDLLL